jgi:glutamate-1-semialdehyde aminotransferase
MKTPPAPFSASMEEVNQFIMEVAEYNEHITDADRNELADLLNSLDGVITGKRNVTVAQAVILLLFKFIQEVRNRGLN